MKKALPVAVLVILLSMPLHAVRYSGGIRATFASVLMKNTSLAHEEALRDSMKATVTLLPASFITGNFDLGLYASLSLQGSTATSGYTRILGNTGLSVGFSSEYLFNEYFSLGLSLGAGYSVTEKVKSGSAFLESYLSASYRVTRYLSASFDTGFIYRRERLELPISFSMRLHPFLKGGER